MVQGRKQKEVVLVSVIQCEVNQCKNKQSVNKMFYSCGWLYCKSCYEIIKKRTKQAMNNIRKKERSI